MILIVAAETLYACDHPVVGLGLNFAVDVAARLVEIDVDLLDDTGVVGARADEVDVVCVPLRAVDLAAVVEPVAAELAQVVLAQHEAGVRAAERDLVQHDLLARRVVLERLGEECLAEAVVAPALELELAFDEARVEQP